MAHEMPESQQSTSPERYLLPLQPGDEVVISGVAGRFPDSDDMKQFKENLLRGADLLSGDERRWSQRDHPELPPRIGMMNGIEKFDTSFFGVHWKQANGMDPLSRLLLERSYEAIVDAGVNPRSLRGSNLGVYIGLSFTESESTLFYSEKHMTELAITGCSRALAANRISYWLGTKGPSMAMDTACSSSLTALKQAYDALRAGQIEAALVGGGNALLHPRLTRLFVRLGVLSPSGMNRPFDDGGDGFVRAEACVVLFLQRSRDARRVYATVLNAGANCDGFKQRGLTCPSGQVQAELMRRTCRSAGIDPRTVAYIEAHATGTKVGDPEECAAMDSVYRQRQQSKAEATPPLLVGSVKSNMGHAEPASALCSVAKVLIAMEERMIPPTIHFGTPRTTIPSLVEGRIKVVTQPTPWEGGVVGVNAFGLGGANAHVLLKSYDRKPTLREEELRGSQGAASLPRLVLVSGRTREGVDVMLREVSRHTPPHEGLVNLLHSIHEENIPGHIYRGFLVAGAEEGAKVQAKDVQYWSGEKRPVWFVFSGMGSQWPTMGAALMQLPVFAAAIQRCHAVLQPRGIDIVRVITANDPKILDNILNCFVGIVSVQIGLVDVIHALGVRPDFLIGHSLGEIACAYADGCLTAEQALLSAHARGRASLEATLIAGAMAAVGLGSEALAALCPKNIDIACVNADDSCTISGPAQELRAFVERLRADGVFAKEVPCGNIAYHSRYIQSTGPLLSKFLQKVIPFPRARSERWLSSSVPESQWDSALAKTCSPEYQTNNQLSPVLFAPLLKRIPHDAVVIEIAPHGLLQAILKRALSAKNVLHVPLASKTAHSPLVHVLSAVGRLYNAGLQPRPAALYPSPQWPVARGTPMLSPLVRWAHDDDWFVTRIDAQRGEDFSAEQRVILSTQSEETRLWLGHLIDGRPLVPATAFLKLVWETAAKMARRVYTDTAVVFEDCRFQKAMRLPTEEGETVTLTLVLHRASGLWEASDGERGTSVASGRVRLVEDASPEYFVQQKQNRNNNENQATPISSLPTDPESGEDAALGMTQREAYKCMRLRGYYYHGSFRGIMSASADGQQARIRWTNDWVSFLDSILQLKILSDTSSEMVVPSYIEKIVVDGRKFLLDIEKKPAHMQIVEARVLTAYDVIASPSAHVEMRGVHVTRVPRRRHDAFAGADPVLERHAFVPLHATKEGEGAGEEARRAWDEAARICAQLALESRAPGVTRAAAPPVRVVEVLGAGRTPLAPLLLSALDDIPSVQGKASVFLEEGARVDQDLPSSLSVVSSANTASSLGEQSDVDIVVLNNGGVDADLALGASCLAAGGSILALLQLQPTANPPFSRTASPSQLQLVSKLLLVGGYSIFHFRKVGWRVDPSQLKVVRVPELAADDVERPEAFAWLEQVKEALKDPNPAEKRVVLVARGPLNGALGFFNCLRAEPGAASQLLRLYALPDEPDDKNASLDVLGKMGLRERLEVDLPVNVLQGGQWGTMRHLKVPSTSTVPVQHAFASPALCGDLSSFDWFQGRINATKSPTDKDMKLIHVYYAALNYRDVMLATGKIPADKYPTADKDSMVGFEFSGRLENGRRVMGLKIGGAISSVIHAHNDLLWNVPEKMTLQEAATIPLAYFTVIYALDMVGHMQAGESVLVHAASGAVGQAAITLAHSRGCRVFATVGTREKKEFLLATFPKLLEDDIGCSRDLTFEHLVMRRTEGKGVDIVLNSLADEKLQASLRCLGTRGRFLELGKVDMINNSAVGMRLLMKEVTVHGILMDVIVGEHRVELLQELNRRLADLLNAGTILPLRRQLFTRPQVEEAFRFMGAGKHIGKVLIAVREGESERGNSKAQPLMLPACPRFYCDPEASYVIVGGLGGMGLELAHWLVERGARALVLVSRRGVATGYQARRLQQWRAAGVRTLVRTDDAATTRGAETLLRAAEALAPVDAIFNLAVVLRDALFDNQTPDAFRESFRCKASAAVRLDAASRRLCGRLRHFVLFSSVSCGRGNAGQTNYGLSNSVMERVARARRAQGLPATAVQWGAVGDVGLVADMRDDVEQLEVGGTLQQKVSSCLQVLDGFLALEHTVMSSMVLAEKKAAASETTVDLTSAIATLLGLRDLKSISHESTLAELGLDSMLTMEIEQMLSKDFDMVLSQQDIRALTFARLRELQTQRTSADLHPSTETKGAELPQSHRAPAIAALLGRRTMAMVFQAINEQQQQQSGSAAKPLTTLATSPGDAPVVSSSSSCTALLFPGLEGLLTPLEALARRLTLRSAFALPLPPTSSPASPHDDSVPGTVQVLMHHIQEALANDAAAGGDFVLIGYSYGGLLALEAAALLEARHPSRLGSGRVVLLESAPLFVRTMVSALAGSDSDDSPLSGVSEETEDKVFEEKLQEGLLISKLAVDFPEAEESFVESVRGELRAQTSWEARADAVLRVCPRGDDLTPLPRDAHAAMLHAVYRRMLAGHRYSWPRGRPRLRCAVTLLVPQSPWMSGAQPTLPHDLGLSEICEKPVHVISIADADHFSLPYKLQTSQAINAVLKEDPQENKNKKKRNSQ